MSQAKMGNEDTLPDFRDELHDLESQLDKDPNNPQLCWKVAMTRGAIYAQAVTSEIKGISSGLDLEDYSDRAVESARRVVEVCPNQSESYTYLASILTMAMPNKTLVWSRLNLEDQVLAAPDLYHDPFPPEAYELYDKALEIDPDDGNYLGIMITNCLRTGRLDRAAELIELSLRFDGFSDSEFKRYQGKLELERGNYDLALELFMAAFDGHPETFDHESDVIETYRRAERFGEMMELADATLQLSPKIANAYLSLAKYHDSQSRDDRAKEALHTYRTLINEQLRNVLLGEDH